MQKNTFIIIIPIVVLTFGIIYYKLKREDESSVNDHQLYISIDFGNYKSSYAYNFDNDNKIIQGKMRRIPSIIILNKNDSKGKNFGKSSVSSISNYDEEEFNKIIYFDNLKKLLQNISYFGDGDINYIKSSKAIIEYLRLLSNEIMKEINSSKNNNYLKVEINWIINAPRIWDDFEKMNLINFAKEAGIHNVELALDSEVSSLSVLNDKIIDNKLKTNGKIFLLVDLGDSKMDISLNEIENTNINQLTEPLGGYFGSRNINEDLMKVLEKVFGKEIIENAKENQFDEYLLTWNSLEELKKKYKKNSSKYYEVYAKFDRNNSFFDNLAYKYINILKKFKKNEIFREFKYENYTIKYDENKIYLPDNLIEKIINYRINEIINYIKSKHNIIKKYDYIVLTGGFSNNPILVNEFRNNFKNVRVLSNQENSVLEGSLIYLKDKKKINSIISYNTYGIKIPSNEKGEKIVPYDLKTLVKKGDIINYDFIKSPNVNPTKDDYLYIDFYKSSQEILSYDDYFVTLVIDLKDYKKNNSDEICPKLIIHFNTYLQLNIYDLKTKDEIKHYFKRENKKKYFINNNNLFLSE